jgi:hypothetical protein
MRELIHQAGKLLGYGSDSHTYEVVGNPNLVLQTIGSVNPNNSHFSIDLEWANKMMSAHKKISGRVSLARILEVGVKDGFPATIMERAQGNQLFSRPMEYRAWSQRLDELASVEQDLYDKAVSDHIQIMKVGLGIDYNPTNLFFDSSHGFTFIDVKNYNKPMTLQTMFQYPVISADNISEQDRKNRLKIASKLRNAGDFIF